MEEEANREGREEKMLENKSEGKQHVRKLAERDGVACQRRGEEGGR